MKKLGRRHSASPVLLEGHMIIPDDDGKVWVVKASPEFEVVADERDGRVDLRLAGRAGGQLFLRTDEAPVLHRPREDDGRAVNSSGGSGPGHFVGK